MLLSDDRQLDDALGVFERAADHRQRRAQFMRQACGHCLEVVVVLVQAVDDVGEAPAQITDLVVGAIGMQAADDSAVVADRPLNVLTQAGDA